MDNEFKLEKLCYKITQFKVQLFYYICLYLKAGIVRIEIGREDWDERGYDKIRFTEII